MRSMSSGEALTGTSRKSAAAMQASVASERKPGVSMMIGPVEARLRAVFQAFSVASSTTFTPPSAFSRAASRAIERCGSASTMVEGRPHKCQCTARQLASVLLPLPPFMVATVMICLIGHLPLLPDFRGRVDESLGADAIGFRARIRG